MNRKPVKGDTIYYTPTGEKWLCDHTKDNVCYSQADELNDNRCFIYWFERGYVFNNLHVILESSLDKIKTTQEVMK